MQNTNTYIHGEMDIVNKLHETVASTSWLWLGFSCWYFEWGTSWNKYLQTFSLNCPGRVFPRANGHQERDSWWSEMYKIPYIFKGEVALEYMQKGIAGFFWGEASNTPKWIHKENHGSSSSHVKTIRTANSIPLVLHYEGLAVVAETWVGSRCSKMWGIYSCFSKCYLKLKVHIWKMCTCVMSTILK